MGDRLAMRHHLDRYDELSEGPPARGLDDEVLRRMASYLLSLAEGRWRRWRRASLPCGNGEERTQKLAGMLLANLPEDALGDQRWTVFRPCCNKTWGWLRSWTRLRKFAAHGHRANEAWLLAMAAQAPCGTATRPSS